MIYIKNSIKFIKFLYLLANHGITFFASSANDASISFILLK